MTAHHIAIQRTGLVTAVGLTAAASCAAFRAKISNPTETRFIDSDGEWIMAQQVPLDQPWRGLTKLAKMAGMAIGEALEGISKDEWSRIPLLLCLAETERPGRAAALDDEVLTQIHAELACTFAPQSAIVGYGRVSAAVALTQARAMIMTAKIQRVMVAATDSFLFPTTLRHYESQDRLLTATNSNGFMPGEAAGALLVGAQQGLPGELVCTGVGFGREAAHIESGEPLRADGLSSAIKAALNEAGCQMRDMDFRITDNSGEHYYFKEATLAASRTLRQRTHEFDIWHPAECAGEIGAVAGVSIIAAAREACEKGYSKGPNILAHMGNDAGERAALCLRYWTGT